MAALADLSDIAGRLSEALDRASIPHAIGGAVALVAHGVVRATTDIDVLVLAPSIRLPAVFDAVRSLGFEGDDRDLVSSIRDRYVATLQSGRLRIDVLVPVFPYHRTVVDRAVRLDVRGRRVPFVSPEDVVVLKMLWRRTKDVADVEALLALRGGTMDRAHVVRTLASILPADDPRHAEIAHLWDRFSPR